MNKKRLLTILTGVIIFFAIITTAKLFSSSLNPSSKAENNAEVIINIGILKTGKVTMKEVGGKPLYFIKPDASQKQAIKELNAHVWNKSLSNYVPELNAYVFWGLSSRWGCTLKHYPKNKVSYSLKWLGGFSDERCNVGYDYAGRTIKTEKFSFYGRIIELPNLIKPNIRAGENGNFIVSLYKS